MSTLFINACIREDSRTLALADHLLKKLGGSTTEVELISAGIRPLDHARLSERENACEDSPILAPAKQFADADTIVIAAPFWDLSFPAILKDYLENICVTGVTFTYENGIPKGLCKAKKLYYVTTCGGSFIPDFGYGYVKALANGFFGITETECIFAEGLDIDGADVEKIMAKAIETIDNM